MKNPRIAAIAIGVAALAAPFEGLRRTMYYDPPGIPTVCFGHTGSDVKAGKVYSIAECKALLEADTEQAVKAVLQCAPNAPDSVAIAFGDAVFNIGPKIACDKANSAAARMLAAGDWTGACNQLPKWDKARVAGQLVTLPGLTRRRAAERDLCLSGVTS